MLTQKLVLGRRPDVYIPGQATHAYILRYWYLVPLIKPPWAAVLYTVSKNDTALVCYNFDKHRTTLIILSRNVAKKVSNQRFFFFPPHLLLHYVGKQKAENCVFPLKRWMLFCQQTHKTHLYYHLVCRDVGRCVKSGGCSLSSLKWQEAQLSQRDRATLYVSTFMQFY